MGVVTKRALLFGVYTRAPDFRKSHLLSVELENFLTSRVARKEDAHCHGILHQRSSLDLQTPSLFTTRPNNSRGPYGMPSAKEDRDIPTSIYTNRLICLCTYLCTYIYNVMRRKRSFELLSLMSPRSSLRQRPPAPGATTTRLGG